MQQQIFVLSAEETDSRYDIPALSSSKPLSSLAPPLDLLRIVPDSAKMVFWLAY